jgi:hypothetical protein
LPRLDDLVGDELLVLLDHRVVVAAADQALDREEGALGVGDRLALGRLADEALAVVGEGDDRRRGARAFRVLDDLRVLAVHDGDAELVVPRSMPMTLDMSLPLLSGRPSGPCYSTRQDGRAFRPTVVPRTAPALGDGAAASRRSRLI